MSVTLEQLGLDRLNADQRQQVIELLWDSLPDDAAFSPPQWHLRELERRLADPVDPASLETWESALARLSAKT